MDTVYIIRGAGTSYYKIGRTGNSVQERVAQFKTGCPFPIEIVFEFRNLTSNPDKT